MPKKSPAFQRAFPNPLACGACLLASLLLTACHSTHPPSSQSPPNKETRTEESAFEIRGSPNASILFHPNHTFTRQEVAGDTLPRVTTGTWECLLNDAPILNLTPGGLYYVAEHDAGTSTIALKVLPPDASPDNPLLYLKTPKGQVFLPQIAAFPGDAPGFQMGWMLSTMPGPPDMFHIPAYPTLMALAIEFESQTPTTLPADPKASRFTSVSCVGGVLMLGIWDEDSEKNFHTSFDSADPKSFNNSDLLIIRTGGMTWPDDLNSPNFRTQAQDTYHALPQLLLKDGPYLYPLFLADWHRNPTKIPDQFTTAKAAYVAFMQSHCVPVPN